MMNIKVNGTKIQVKLYDNSSADAVKELLKKGPLNFLYKIRKSQYLPEGYACSKAPPPHSTFQDPSRN